MAIATGLASGAIVGIVGLLPSNTSIHDMAPLMPLAGERRHVEAVVGIHGRHFAMLELATSSWRAMRPAQRGAPHDPQQRVHIDMTVDNDPAAVRAHPLPRRPPVRASWADPPR